MTKQTDEAIQAAIEVLYVELGGYGERLKSSQRTPEDQAVYEQLFTQDLRRVRSEALQPFVRLLQLSSEVAQGRLATPVAAGAPSGSGPAAGDFATAHPKHAGRTQQFKYLLPRLCAASLDPLPAIGFPLLCDLLGRFDFERWPASERRAVWDYLLLYLRALLEDFGQRRSPPWGAYGYFRELCRATEEVGPALLIWQTADFVTSLLHLAAFVNTWVEDRPLRERQSWGRPQMAAIDRWVAEWARPCLQKAALDYGAEPYAPEFAAAAAKSG